MARPAGDTATRRQATSVDPDDARKPDSPDDLTARSWKYILRKTLREFMTDQCTDLAASLTYFGTLAVFPAMLAFVSILGLLGDAQKTTNDLIGLAEGLVPASTLDALRGPIETLTQSPAAGITLAAGILGALWSASGYVGAFGRALNRIYSIQEGRPFYRLRAVNLVVTILAIVVAVLAALLLVVSGPIADSVGSALGLGHTVLLVWNILKWPILVILAVILVAVLYYATPNVRQPRFRWTSIGSVVALGVLAAASAGFAVYAANFSKYNSTYGAIGGVIVALLWIWISNNALLFGAELDAELERGRELQAGIEAEETLRLPPRATKKSEKAQVQHEKDIEAGRALRLSRGEADVPADLNTDEHESRRRRGRFRNIFSRKGR